MGFGRDLRGRQLASGTPLLAEVLTGVMMQVPGAFAASMVRLGPPYRDVLASGCNVRRTSQPPLAGHWSGREETIGRHFGERLASLIGGGSVQGEVWSATPRPADHARRSPDPPRPPVGPRFGWAARGARRD